MARVISANAELSGLDLTTLERVTDPGSHSRGIEYASSGAVTRVLWNTAAGALLGTVRGSGNKSYTATAVLSGDRLRFDHGRCSCPVGHNCKHVVALVLAAATGTAGPRSPRGPSWEKSLTSLLDSRMTSPRGQTPLAIELSFFDGDRHGHQPKLFARLVRPGKRGGWVAGDLSWSALDHWVLYGGDYLEQHVRLALELRALTKLRGGAFVYQHYHHADEKSIDLAACDTPRLWPVLAEAEQAGLLLVHADSRLGPVQRTGSAELCLDVTGAESLSVSPVLRADGADDPMPLAFLGPSGHGVVYAERSDLAMVADPRQCLLYLAPLDKPAPLPLQRLVLSRARVDVPAADQERFRTEFYPRLRHLATVVSSDESFQPPEISAPTLVLSAHYGSGHDVDVSWCWRYQLGGSALSIPASHELTEPGLRDSEAEQSTVDLLDGAVEDYGLATTAGRVRTLLNGRISGLDTMRFTTEVVPLLAGCPGVVVETSGERPDYREAGDSLRIGLSTDSVAGENDWFDLGVTISVEGREVPFATVFAALAGDASHLLLDDGAYFSLQKPELQSLRRLIEEARALQESPSGQVRISRFQADLWDELRSLGVVDRQAAAWQQQVEGLLELGGIDQPPLPESLTAELRPYQAEGFAWLRFLWRHQLGGVLADDMGLGKTLQTLALISHAKQDDPDVAPFLIVAPASVVANWAQEAARFTPDLTVVPVTETLARRRESIDEIVAGADVVVISYALLRLDIDAYSATTWSGLVLDEAQFAKNHQSKVYQAARRLPAPFKLAITGTPMENNLMELWSLLSIAAPGLFPSPTRFRDYYARPIEKAGETERLAQLRRRIKPLLKRRTKEQVAADLPAKQEQVLEVELHPRHRTIYQRQLQRERQKVLGLLDDVDRNRLVILRSLTLLRQLSLHPGLVDDDHANVPCAKIDALFEQLGEVVDGGHRALVFSQFTGFLELVRDRLDAAGIPYCYLDGKTRKRAEVIERFKGGAAPVFLISLKAGGFGLNLTEADYCFLLDPWWNPATEAQAVDRTHRIGQTRNVMVYRLISAGTIEEKVMALKARKAELFASVLSDGNAFGSVLEADDIRALFE